jgi:predicted ATPase
VDNWNLKSIQGQMESTSNSPAKDQAVVALGAFVEMLESRTAERSLLANRLEIFTKVIGDFFHDKTVSVSPRSGLLIKTNPPEKRTLKEHQLSTGEYHLLYLMVAALVTQRRGTVLAIDEPEMSMHLAWQRKLISGLFQCASKAEPQFIFATHSPDVAADFPDALVELGK